MFTITHADFSLSMADKRWPVELVAGQLSPYIFGLSFAYTQMMYCPTFLLSMVPE